MWKRVYDVSNLRGNKGQKCSFVRTLTADTKVWVDPKNGRYEVKLSKHLGDYQFVNKTMTTFDTAKAAREWFDKSYNPAEM